MFSFDKLNQTPDALVAENYGIEVGGHFLAIQEAFADLADINEEFAAVNNQGVDAYAEGYATGGEEGAQVAMESFQGDIVTEGFLGKAKDRIISALKSLKEKLAAFFESAHKYFDALWKNGRDFADKYGDEIGKKDLAGFKHEMFEYDLGAVKIDDIFSRVKDAVYKKAASTTKELESGSFKKKVGQEVMHAICGESVTSGDAFRKAIIKKMHKGATVKREIAPNVGEIIKALREGEELDDCKSAKSDCESSFNDEISALERLEKDTKDNGQESFAKNIKARYGHFVEAKNISMSAFDAYKSVVVERNSAYKSCLSKALHYSAKK